MPKQIRELAGSQAAELESWFRNEVQPHETETRGLLRSMVAVDDIDDLMQEAFLRLLKARQKGPVFHTRALLMSIARNAALDSYRRKQSRHTNSIGVVEFSNVLDDAPSTQDVVTLRQENLILEEAIRRLPDRCRSVLVLRRLEGLSQQDIAGRLGISVKTVEAQMTKALRQCGEYLVRHSDRARSRAKGSS